MDEFCHVVPVVFVIEPYSVPNHGNEWQSSVCGEWYENWVPCSNPVCGARADLGIGTVMICFDAAHWLWLGWNETADGFLREFKTMRRRKLL